VQESAACNSGTKYHIPEGLMALLLVYPILLSMIIKSVKSETVFFSWALSVGSLIALFVVHDYRLSLPTFISISCISFLKLYEFQRQKISMFFLSQKLRGIQTENERLEKENRASELRHLIGNVAHDLKTVRLCESALFSSS
jgi:signal transduction histidine kinase